MRIKPLGRLGTHYRDKVEIVEESYQPIAISIERGQQLVKLDFGTNLSSIAMNVESARGLIDCLVRACEKLEEAGGR